MDSLCIIEFLYTIMQVERLVKKIPATGQDKVGVGIPHHAYIPDKGRAAA